MRNMDYVHMNKEPNGLTFIIVSFENNVIISNLKKKKLFINVQLIIIICCYFTCDD
jgi:hypothetical protein